MTIEAENTVHEEVVNFVTTNAPAAKLFQHRASKTSEESMQARLEASGERVVGAKALLVKIDVKDSPEVFAVIILPGVSRLDSKVVKQELRERVVGARDFRFASSEEMEHVARGMQPGKMPPFGRPIFPDVQYTFIDKALLDQQKIGFNAADFEHSIIMPTEEYIKITPHDGVFLCSTTEGL